MITWHQVRILEWLQPQYYCSVRTESVDTMLHHVRHLLSHVQNTVVCFITKSFLTYSFFPPTHVLSTISRPLSSSMCSITPETAKVPQSLATNGPGPGPRPLTCGVSSECLGTRSYETTSRDQRGKIQMFFSSTGACTAAKFPIANHHSQINTQLYSASLIRLIWQQRHSDSEFDAL